MEFTHSGALGKPAVTAAKDELTETVATGLYDSAFLSAKHVPGKNIVFCATFPLVWEEVAQVGGSTILMQYDPPLCIGLQADADYKNDVDPASIYTAGGFGSGGIQATILEQMARRFSSAASPKLIPDAFEPDRLFAYAYMWKQLAYDEREGTYTRIAVGERPNQYVLDLPTHDSKERLIVASIAPGNTLAESVDRAMKAPLAPTQVPCAWALEKHRVPRIHFDVTWKFRTTSARYHFKLDERGATLLSEAAQMALPLPGIIVAKAGGPTDTPILVAMMRRGAKRPYFAAWIENTELLLPDPED